MANAQLSSTASLTMLMPSGVIHEKSNSPNNSERPSVPDGYRKKKNNRRRKPHLDQKISLNTTSTPRGAENILVGDLSAIQNPSAAVVVSTPLIPKESIEKSGREKTLNDRTNCRDAILRGKNKETLKQENVEKKAGLRESGQNRKRASNQQREPPARKKDSSREPILTPQNTAQSNNQNGISSRFTSVSALSTPPMTPIPQRLPDPNEEVSDSLSLLPLQEEKNIKNRHSEKGKHLPGLMSTSQTIGNDPAIVSLRCAAIKNIQTVEENPPKKPCEDIQSSNYEAKERTSLNLLPPKEVATTSYIQNSTAFTKIPLSNSLRSSKGIDQAVVSLEGAALSPPPFFSPVEKSNASATPSSPGINTSPLPPLSSSSATTTMGSSRKLRAEAAEFHPSGFSYEAGSGPMTSLSSLFRGFNTTTTTNGGSKGNTPQQPFQMLWHSHRAYCPAKTSSPSFFSLPVSACQEEEDGSRGGANAASTSAVTFEADCATLSTTAVLTERPSVRGSRGEFPSAPQTQTPYPPPPCGLSLQGGAPDMSSPGNPKSGGDFSPISFSSGNVSGCQLARCVIPSPFPPEDEAERGDPSSPPPERGGDTVRLTHLAIADDVAMDEGLMYDLLADADADAEDLEDEILYFKGKEDEVRVGGGGISRFQFSPSSNGDWETRSSASAHSHVRHENQLGGYWSLDGPRVMEATRLYPPSSRSNGGMAMEGAENAATTYPCGGNPHPPPRTLSTFTMDYDDYGDIWRVERSSDEDSLDEEQVLWIEEQLRLNENPKAFY
ncbi:unnamed protein product [Phytomonas sp. Hart1]|nr:unnamed protein product [Phytomonas sp. Hart1]|eukprot:CCW67575.1 unnamed protein product [Phytomonas sp. isolate Hart1]